VDTEFAIRDEVATQSQEYGYSDIADEELDLLLMKLKLQTVETGKRRKLPGLGRGYRWSR
jgi:hypothetical protein